MPPSHNRALFIHGLRIVFASGLLIIAALVIGILAGHYGWGRRIGRGARLHPDYLAGLDYLVTEQPDRALDMFLKLMDANAETVETHFALGALYRRRGEVQRATRIHQNLLARTTLLPEHREQALLALANDYLRAGVLDRAEQLFEQVSAVPRLRANALDALRGVYERQREWVQALRVYRELTAAGAAPAASIGAQYLCELAELAIARGQTADAEALLHDACRERMPCPRASLLRAKIAQSEGQLAAALSLLLDAVRAAPVLLAEYLPLLVTLAGEALDAVLGELAHEAASNGPAALKTLVLAACSAQLAHATPLREPIEQVFTQDESLRLMHKGMADHRQLAAELGALLEHAERYRCTECGFSGRRFYWQCPACLEWESFESHAVIKLQ